MREYFYTKTELLKRIKIKGKYKYIWTNKLKIGDTVMVKIQYPSSVSRHFGMAYEGFCLEC